MSDEKYYGQALREWESGSIDEDLRAKAYVLTGGDEAGVKTTYVRMRAESLKRSQLKDRITASATGASDIQRPRLPFQGLIRFVLFSWFSVIVLLGVVHIVLAESSQLTGVYYACLVSAIFAFWVAWRIGKRSGDGPSLPD